MNAIPWTAILPLTLVAPLLGLVLAGPDGRTGRAEYALWLLWGGLVYPSGFVLLLAGAGHHSTTVWWLYVVLYLAQIYILGMQTARRLHDAGRSRWLGLPALVPLLGVIPGFGLLLLAPDVRKYGLGWRPAAVA